MEEIIDFRTQPSSYHHWKIRLEGNVAWLGLSVNENETIRPGYELKLNSYDLAVDIELHDAIQRLRFEHPGVACVVIHSLDEKVFCAGANIKMLGQASHEHKVNFCKFTNETRNEIENATSCSYQTYICAIEGSCAGGGYEIALACQEIIMVDDGSTSVSFPELPLLGVLPGTGGLTRLVDKRKVRRDHADFFCTTEEGLLASRALKWGLVDHIAPPSKYKELLEARAATIACMTKKKPGNTGIKLNSIDRKIENDTISYQNLRITIDREMRCAQLLVRGPQSDCPGELKEMISLGSQFWPLQVMRELEDAVLHLRFNEPETSTWLIKSHGDSDRVLSFNEALWRHRETWFISEINLFIERVLKRFDISARSIITAIEPNSCFHGPFFELALIADQTFMLLGQFENAESLPAKVSLNGLNFGSYRMANSLTRLETRFFNDEEALQRAFENNSLPLDAEASERLGLVTFIPDDIDWEDELRLTIESRASFSGDALTGMEANLRFPGPETIESKIFSRLSAWQNWIFQRPNAVGERGALSLYGSGELPFFYKKRT